MNAKDWTPDHSLQIMNVPNWTPDYSSWRHGGWYVNNVRYPSGAVGCVSRNYKDRKWRIACDSRDFDTAPTFKNRDEAAFAERELARAECRAAKMQLT